MNVHVTLIFSYRVASSTTRVVQEESGWFLGCSVDKPTRACGPSLDLKPERQPSGHGRYQGLLLLLLLRWQSA